MTKKNVIRRMDDTIEMIKSIPWNEFSMDTNIYINSCGVVKRACVAGWYTELKPTAKLVAIQDGSRHNIGVDVKGGGKYVNVDRKAVHKALSKYHGLTEDAIKILFYNSTCYTVNKSIEDYLISKDAWVYPKAGKKPTIKMWEAILDSIIANDRFKFLISNK